MIDPNDPLVQLKITGATCSFFAFGTTIYRLYKRHGRYRADDGWALFAFLSLIIQDVSVFLHVPVPNHLSKTARVAAYYLMAATFYAIIWASRLSILYSIVRIDPSQDSRKRLFWVAVAFVVAALFLLAQLLWVCEPEPSWKNAPNPQCRLPLQVAMSATDVIADSILLIAPIPLFRHLADKALRRKLTIIFSTCVVTTVVSLVHAAFILRRGGVKVLISALVENSLSLIVANLPIVIARLINLARDEDDSDPVGRQTTSLRFNSRPWFSKGGVTTRGTGIVAPVELGMTGISTTIAAEEEEDREIPPGNKRLTSVTWDKGAKVDRGNGTRITVDSVEGTD
ncbi:hypothetical protein FB45DRAFT_1039220 [Roridomyces roridus]|uniref:Rhodopsin domain-containing protein n=1 Tax=Roridomyces roridus TaxID=1738132 RepID=A0AAD7B2T6_9AGAR|nr:hypothetical protein FB45DRAFT_1039220 [Roridomyces roridus]